MVTEDAEQKELSDDFKRKVARWEVAGVFDQIAAKVDEVLEKQAGMGGGADRYRSPAFRIFATASRRAVPSERVGTSQPPSSFSFQA